MCSNQLSYWSKKIPALLSLSIAGILVLVTPAGFKPTTF